MTGLFPLNDTVPIDELAMEYLLYKQEPEHNAELANDMKARIFRRVGMEAGFKYIGMAADTLKMMGIIE
jgi:hypothetical protein